MAVVSNIFLLFLLCLSVKAPVVYRARDVLAASGGLGLTKKRSGDFLPGYRVPGNKVGKYRQSVPGLSLPGQVKQFSHQVPFNPFTQMIGNDFILDKDDSFGYGIGIHGLNMLNLDAQRMYPFFANSRNVRSDGRWLPFTFGFNTGSEFDFTKKWKAIGGKLDIPIPGLNELFDLSGYLVNKNSHKSNTKGALDFPILGTPYRFPLHGSLSKGTGDFAGHYGQVIHNLNSYGIRPQQIVNQWANGREANPSHFGYRRQGRANYYY